jgi:hypothetical protein
MKHPELIPLLYVAGILVTAAWACWSFREKR